jgi:hypothetical protein
MKRFFVSLLFLSLVLVPNVEPVLGQTSTKPNLQEQVSKQLGVTAEKAALSNADPRLVIAETIQFILSLVGIIFVGLIVLAGYWRFTANGEEEKIQKSNKTIMGAVIGLFIIMLSYAVAEFVVRRVQNAVQEEQIYDVSNQGPPKDQWAIPIFGN